MQSAPELQRLLQLPSSIQRTGVGRSQYDDTQGIWQQAIGLNPFLSDDNSRFLMATTASPTRIGNSQVTDIPIAYSDAIENPDSDILWVLGSGGRFYQVLDNDTVNVIRPQSTLTALTNACGGMAPVTDSGGNSYLFVCTQSLLVRWNLNTADSNAHWNTSNGLVATTHHPMHRLFDTTYFGNGNYLGSIPHTSLHNQATTLTNVNFQLINFGTEQTATAISDDGRYVLVAMCPSFDATTNATTTTRIIWYPNTGINWDWEVTLRGERAIRQIVRNALGTFAIGEQTIYELQFGAQPRLVRTFDTADSPGGAFAKPAQNVGPRANIAAPFGDSLIFGKRGAVFGKRFPTEKVTFSHPLQGNSSDISMIAPDYLKNRVYIGTEDSRLAYYAMDTAGSTSNSYKTRWFDLKTRCAISRLAIEMPQGIGSSDVLGITVEVPSGDTTTVSLSQALIASRDRTYPQLLLKPTLQGSQVRFTFTPSAGAPKWGTVTLYGQPNRE